MTVQDIAIMVENEFSKFYPHFQEFQKNTDYKKYWGKCVRLFWIGNCYLT